MFGYYFYRDDTLLSQGKNNTSTAMEKIYDYIRMLDAEGYPRAYIDYGDYRLSFENAKFDKEGGELEAKVVFRKKSIG